MVWARGWRRAGAAGVLALCLATSAWADTLVVRASGPSAQTYRPGAKLPDGGSVALKAGDVITLLDGKGTRTLRGPGTFPVAAAATAPAANVTLSALLDTKRVRRARTGAVRGTIKDGPAAGHKRPNLWLIDVAQPGLLCLADPAAVRLWRADSTKPATFHIHGVGGHAAVAFAVGDAIAAWPTALPLADGAAYRIEGGARPVDIRLATLDQAQPGLDAVAAGLIARGCEAQLDLLVDVAASGPAN